MTEKIKLITRICACGCGRSWKCMPKSLMIYFSLDECIEELEKKMKRINYGKGVFEKPRTKPRKF